MYQNILSYYAESTDYYAYLYSDHLKSSKRILKAILAKMNQNNIKSVLDACCGVGDDVEFFLRNGFTVDASDLSEKMLIRAKHKTRKYTKSNLSFVCANVLDLNRVINSRYDLVVFRGNTLGHLRQEDQLCAVKQLYDRTKPGKFLLFDFRDGDPHFKERKKCELRGCGINITNSKIFFSYYKIDHPTFFSDPYSLHPIVLLFDYSKLKFQRIQLEIEGNYVNSSLITELLLTFDCTYEFIPSNKGLRYLKTILVHKHS